VGDWLGTDKVFKPSFGSASRTSYNNFNSGLDNIYNKLWGSEREFAAFTDGDTTPDVSDGDSFKTANTGATNLTDLDNGYEGQTIVVVFDDANTTVDFTGTNLKGNQGTDWSPVQYDSMYCTYDGTFWYCLIGDTSGGGTFAGDVKATGICTPIRTTPPGTKTRRCISIARRITYDTTSGKNCSNATRSTWR